MIVGRNGPVDRPPLRTVAVPIASTLAGSAMGLVPMIATEPLLPPFGLMMLLAWRLLRPEMWAAWIALPLGLVDDLVNGHNPGTAMALWTMALLVLDWIDHQFVWRDWWMEWAIAVIATILTEIGIWALSLPIGSHGSIALLLPQLLGSALLFPAILRLTAALDRWRLRR
jgi:rod shape-determining protein MreD